MNRSRNTMRWLWALIPGLALVPSIVVSLPASDVRVAAIQATEELSDNDLLDVGILAFDPGVEGTDTDELEERGVFAEVRESEGIFVPVQLRRTLESTGLWGAVRVIPASTDAVDLIISGVLLESTGKELAVAVRAVDATGRQWLDKRYSQQADERAYTPDARSGEAAESEPFQSLYNRIANDLVSKRAKLEPAELAAARDVARLKFAAELAPAAFAECLGHDKKGHLEILCLPAEGDPMMARVESIRERDYLLVDTLNEYYSTFFDRMTEPYQNWRAFSHEEQLAFEELRRKARRRKIFGALAILGAIVVEGDSRSTGAARDVAVLGGMAAIQSGIGKSQEAKMHREALRELGTSFGAEVEPHLVDVEGQTLRLTGTAETQYLTWRKLLVDLYTTETGEPVDPNAERTPIDESVSR